MAIPLIFLATIEKPNVQVINVFNDILKVFAGALAGAIAGEKNNMDKKSKGGLVDYRKGGLVTKTVNNLKNKK